jgi:hypothetical protein
MRKFAQVTMPILGMAVLILGATTAAWASPPVPEIDPASASSALALIVGAALLIRGRRSK